jgi:L-tartrate/succinate antiporter
VFVAVIIGLITERIRAAVVGPVGVTGAAVPARFVLFSPEQLAQLSFKSNTAAISCVLSGFSNPTLWLIFAAFVFSLG